jgi:hypothetical protein
MMRAFLVDKLSRPMIRIPERFSTHSNWDYIRKALDQSSQNRTSFARSQKETSNKSPKVQRLIESRTILMYVYCNLTRA